MKILLKELLDRSISELGVAKRAFQCTPKTSVQDAVHTMRKDKVGALAIVDADKVVGIFTERDFLEKIAFQGLEADKTPVSEYMTANPTCVQRHESIGSVLEKMRKGGFRHVIITDAYGHLEKVVSLREVMDYLVTPLATAA